MYVHNTSVLILLTRAELLLVLKIWKVLLLITAQWPDIMADICCALQ